MLRRAPEDKIDVVADHLLCATTSGAEPKQRSQRRGIRTRAGYRSPAAPATRGDGALVFGANRHECFRCEPKVSIAHGERLYLR